jgi:hypothetical protein
LIEESTAYSRQEEQREAVSGKSHRNATIERGRRRKKKLILLSQQQHTIIEAATTYEVLARQLHRLKPSDSEKKHRLLEPEQ